jgi:cyclopropane fatty-acyl-phospholipid synthase-like methyltransferase
MGIRSQPVGEKPFVQLADIATAEYEHPFDVMIAMSLFESLTEEQIRSLLTRARAWVKQALFATIPTISLNESGAIVKDRDLSHITMRDRQWWLSQFIDAGWHQDALHRAFERVCQDHTLPRRMGWTVYVFSP